MAYLAHLGRVRREDQAVFATVDPGVLPRVGESYVREAGEESDVPDTHAGWSVGQQARGWKETGGGEEDILHGGGVVEPAIEFGWEDQEVGVIDLAELLQGYPRGAGLAGSAKGFSQLPALNDGATILAGEGGDVKEPLGGFFGFFDGGLLRIGVVVVSLGDDADQELPKKEAGQKYQHGEFGVNQEHG